MSMILSFLFVLKVGFESLRNVLVSSYNQLHGFKRNFFRCVKYVVNEYCGILSVAFCLRLSYFSTAFYPKHHFEQTIQATSLPVG